MSDTPALVQQVKQLESSSGWWANVSLWLIGATALVAALCFGAAYWSANVSQWLLGVTALVAALYFGASYRALKIGRELNKAQGALTKAKDDQLAVDKSESDQQIARLQKDAADAKDAQQKVETELAREQEGAANAERALLELQERMSDRRFNEEQTTELTNALAKGPRCPVKIGYLASDGEAQRFTAILSNLLKAAGWDVSLFYSRSDAMDPGITILQRTADKREPCTEELCNAFDLAGMKTKVGQSERPDEGSLWVLVGPKP